MRQPSSKSGFTIIELLVVIALILLVSSFIFIGGGGGDGAALTASQRIVSGVAKGARSQAILKNTEARLIIHNDSSEPDKYRRLFGIIYADPEDESGTPDWIAGSQGTLLPEGIYFDPELSESALSSSWSLSNETQIEFPRAVAKSLGSGTDFYHYEFNSNGTMASGFSNAALVIRAGTLKPDGSNYSIDFDDEEKEYIASALIFRRVGTSTLVTDPSAIVD